MSYLIKNNFRYSTLNDGFVAKYGDYINFNNTIEHQQVQKMVL